MRGTRKAHGDWSFDLGQAFLRLGVSPDGRTIVFTRVDNPSNDLMLMENFR